MRHWSVLLILPALLAATHSRAAESDPIALHPENPHYFLWRGRPTILITSGEHYGAVLNRAFDFQRYLGTLQADGLNLTRTFSGAYCEPVGAFKITNNTLAPARGDLLCPWARSDTPGYANGGNKFDLNQWDRPYFQRLTEFVAEAGKRGVVVELVLFCPFYEDAMWQLSPMNACNNVNGVGDLQRTEVYTLQNGNLLAVQEAMVQQIVQALADCDNVYYEICNEPYFGGVTEDWQAHIAEMIVKAESGFKKKHLIAQNIANKGKSIQNPNRHVSIFNFHYAKPPTTVADNYHLQRALGDDETGFAGQERVRPYRREGWDFLLAGGAVYSNLDYSFSVGSEDGTGTINAPGGGGPELRKQLRILKDFIEGFDFLRMKPETTATIVQGKLPEGVTARVLSEAGKAYALYVNGSNVGGLVLALPPGSYQAQWVSTKTGQVEKTESIQHEGGTWLLPAPPYMDDIALRIRAVARNPS
jgi:hypothetical protein